MRSSLTAVVVACQLVAFVSSVRAQQPRPDAGVRRRPPPALGPCVPRAPEVDPAIAPAPAAPRVRRPRLVVVPPDPNRIRDTSQDAVMRAQATEAALVRDLPRALRGIERCYGALLRSEPALEGGVAFTLTVAENGALGADDDRIDATDERLAECVRTGLAHARVSPRFSSVLVPVAVGLCARDRAVCFAGVVTYDGAAGFAPPSDVASALDAHVRTRLPTIEAAYRALVRRRRQVTGPLRVYVSVTQNGRTSGLGLTGMLFGSSGATDDALDLFTPIDGACLVPAPPARVTFTAAFALSRP